MPERRGRRKSTGILSADIVLLLVSVSFIASDYCWGDEMAKALARHKEKKARVIPIILHPCRWLRTPLKVLQGIPRDNKAISLWANEHAAFDAVVTEIAKVVDDLRRSRTAEPEHVEQASAVAAVASMEAAPSAPHPPADAGPSLSHEERETPSANSSLSHRERGGVRVDPRDLPDFAVFRDGDAPWCPEMVVIPAGSFLMGSPENEPERLDWEGPPASRDDRRSIRDRPLCGDAKRNERSEFHHSCSFSL